MAISAYKGKEEYIFVSYAHRNESEVRSILRVLQDKGLRFYFDEWIEPSKAWAEDLALHLQESRGVLAFITPEYMESQNCLDELAYCKAENKDLLIVYLKETTLSAGWKMQLNRKQDIKRWEYRTEEAFFGRLLDVEMMTACLERTDVEDAADIETEEELLPEPLPDVTMTPKAILDAVAYRLDLKEPETDLAKKQVQWLRLCGGALAVAVGILLIGGVNADWLYAVKGKIGFDWSEETVVLFWCAVLLNLMSALIAVPHAISNLRAFPQDIYDKMVWMLPSVAEWQISWMIAVLIAKIQFQSAPMWQIVAGGCSVLIGALLANQAKSLLNWGSLFNEQQDQRLWKLMVLLKVCTIVTACGWLAFMILMWCF